MGAGSEASPRHARGADVLARLRTATAVEHEQVESTLGLMDPQLGRDRLVAVLTRAADMLLDRPARTSARSSEDRPGRR